MKSTSNPVRACPECRQPLPADAPEGLCPECLMVGGLDAISLERKPEEEVPEGRLPAIGEDFGGYRIDRELGRGGMGAVFEAEQLETGRRVALKLLNHQLDSPEARARFLREGRLAASINHPNSVYVYGTEEIKGLPAIAMELVAGGTLEDHVKNKGPLPVGEAVDAVLQIIAGLEAAQAIGILHRDVKPGNCFEGADGAVKIGDFGLSISTEARGETHLTLEGAILGTPAFASPEQLRGEELNARSDIYSVGVTLYYLLTGRTPFRGKSLAQIFANVLEGDAPPPSEFAPKLPAGLVKAVMRCLEKTPGDRFKDYAELREALVPFGSEAPVPAPLPLRFLAACIDQAALQVVPLLAGFFGAGFFGFDFLSDSMRDKGMMSLVMVAGYLGLVLYYTVFEGLRGAALGKWVCRLEVTGPERNPPGLFRAFLRVFVFHVLTLLPMGIYFRFDASALVSGGSNWVDMCAMYSSQVLMALCFVTARRRNGFASVHDLATGTRVVRRAAVQARDARAPGKVERVSASEDTPKVGPFHILEPMGTSGGAEWSLGYDSRLLRKVWIREVGKGTPPWPMPLRQLGRIGRLRWIGGMRSKEGNWDAFEAPGGRALTKLFREEGAQAWSRVRYWIADIAREIEISGREGPKPAILAPGRVWITAEGRAKMLDFAAPGEEEEESGAGGDPGELLGAMAAMAADPLPLHARGFRENLPEQKAPSAMVAAIQPLLGKMAAVSRARRAALVAGCAAAPVFVMVMLYLTMPFLEKWQEEQADIMPLMLVLSWRESARNPLFEAANLPSDRLFSIYISRRFRETIEDEAGWNSPFAVSLIKGEDRLFAEEAVARDWEPTEEEIRQAEEEIGPHAKEGILDEVITPSTSLMLGTISLVMYVGLPALFLALICRGGLVMLIAGVAVSRADGKRASRLRVFWRSLVAWSPFLLLLPLAMGFPYPGVKGGAVVGTAAAFALVAISIWLPGRGLQDRLAGTVLVPR